MACLENGKQLFPINATLHVYIEKFTFILRKPGSKMERALGIPNLWSIDEDNAERFPRRVEKNVFLHVSMLSCTSQIDDVSMNDVTSPHV